MIATWVVFLSGVLIGICMAATVFDVMISPKHKKIDHKEDDDV